MIVYAKLANTELTKYDVKDVRLYEFIKVALKKHIDNGRITYMRDGLNINLNNCDSYKDGYYDEFNDTRKHTYRPLVTLNGKKLDYGTRCRTLEQIGVK